MGEHADDIIDQIIDGWFDSRPLRKTRRKHNHGVRKGQWRDATGHVWNMSDMTTTHIFNCLNHCERHGNSVKKAEFEEELQKRTEAEPDE